MQLLSAMAGSVGDLAAGIITPSWMVPSRAQLASSGATMVADARVDAVIRSMSSMQSWNIARDLTGGAHLAVSAALGSAASLGQLMSEGIMLSGGGTQITYNNDGTVTVAASVDHDVGVASVMERFDARCVLPAQESGVWFADLLGGRGDAVAQSMADFSSELPRQILDFVKAGLASPVLGAGLVPNVPHF